MILALEAQRHNAQLALDAAYKALIDQAKHPKAELDDEEAELSDGSDAGSDDEDESMEAGNLSAMSIVEDDEDDADYIPEDE